MAFNYANMTALATRLITKFGQSATFSRYTYSNNTGTGAVTRSATTTATANAVVLEGQNDMLPQSLAAHAEREVLVSGALSFEPRALDEVSVGGVVWKVVAATVLNPGGTPVLYTLGVLKQ